MKSFIEDKVSFGNLVSSSWRKFADVNGPSDPFATIKIVDLIKFVKSLIGRLLCTEDQEQLNFGNSENLTFSTDYNTRAESRLSDGDYMYNLFGNIVSGGDPPDAREIPELSDDEGYEVGRRKNSSDAAASECSQFETNETNFASLASEIGKQT